MVGRNAARGPKVTLLACTGQDRNPVLTVRNHEGTHVADQMRADQKRADQKRPVISDGLPSQLPDIDPDETGEWIESLDGVIDERGRRRARYVMLRLLERARERQVGVPPLTTTDYINTITPEPEPWFPG